MTFTARRMLLGFALILVPSTCFAGAADVVACRDIKEDAARLACFDRTIGGLATDLQATQKTPFDFFGLFSSKPTSEKDFGATAGSPAARDRDHDVPPVTSMTDKLDAVWFKDGKPVFYFDNGQVWAAQESRRVTLKGDGTDRAKVEKSFVSYFITVNDSSAQISVIRVK